MLSLTTLNGFNASVLSSNASVTYVTATHSSATATAYTFSAHNIGTAASDRFVVVGIFGLHNGGGTGTISSVTIGGSTATLLNKLSDYSLIGNWGLYGLTVTSGTTADIIVTFDRAMEGASIAVWNINGLISVTPTDTQSATATSGAVSVTLNIQSGGVGLAVGGRQSVNTTYTWGGLTEDFDASMDAASDSGSGASLYSAAGNSALSVTLTPASAGTHEGLVAIAMR